MRANLPITRIQMILVLRNKRQQVERLIVDKRNFKSEKELFTMLAERISAISGVQLGEKQDSMIDSRLRKHLRTLGHRSPESYWAYFCENEESEMQKLISLLTTHHTFFFREAQHFDYLTEMLPAYLSHLSATKQNELVIQSAACSLGHEGYTIAMLLQHHLKRLGSTMPWRIVFHDIDPKSLATARAAVYRNEELSRIPQQFLDECWVKGKGTAEGYSKIKSAILQHCHFETKNLKQLAAAPPVPNSYDFIFCRNVFIYFLPKDIEMIVKQMTPSLRDQGRFFIGISEKLAGLQTPLEHLGNSIYQKKSKELTS